MQLIMNLNVLEEQSLIQQLYNLITSNSNDNYLFNNILEKVQGDYSYSYILNYYIGTYYEKLNLFDLAEIYFNKSIQIQPLFTDPYFKLADILIKNNNFEKTQQLLNCIFNKKTLDPYSPSGSRSYNFMVDLRIMSILIPKFMELKDYKKAEYYIKQILSKFKELNKKNLVYRHLELWKNIHISYANIYMTKYFNLERANEIYFSGLEGLCDYKHTQTLDIAENLHKLDVKLYQGYVITSHYINIFNIKNLSFDVNDLFQRYRVSNGVNTIFDKTNDYHNNRITFTENKTKKIKIGYISPDFNKNAVGLFVSPLLKYYDKNKFEVFIYYTNESFDEFTSIFQSYIDKEHWFNINKMGIQEQYNLIKYNHQLDVLVDLITFGVGSSMELIAKKPAQIIINYLGFPDKTGLKEFDYRIVDKITDPIVNSNSKNSETLIYMPNCFICYSLFENITMPNISYNNQTDNVHIGVMNKIDKHSDIIRKTWLDILQQQKKYILFLKIGKNDDINMVRELYKEFPKNQIQYLPFTDSLEEYFEQFNNLDFCIDTYPYSGTTTTCSSLLMGVPVFTIYRNEEANHVSNVTSSINVFTSNDIMNCKNLKEYKSKILSYKVNKSIENNERIKRRELFLKCMDPKKFMEDYENLINNLITENLKK